MDSLDFKFILLNELINPEKVTNILINSKTNAKFSFQPIQLGASTINSLQICFNPLHPYTIDVQYNDTQTDFCKKKQFSLWQLKRFLICCNLYGGLL